VGTITSSYNEPFHVARRLASLDLISGGRAGWNVVTSGDGGTAGNFGLDEHYDYDTRYARGLEHVRVCQGLWDSYEDDAFVRDRATRRFLDPDKLHALDHVGEHFSVTGPPNIARSRQGQPVSFQAGDSDQGRDLGATIGEGIFTHAPSLEAGQAFYRDIEARAAAKGRNPDHLLVRPGISVYVGDTDAEAREIEHAYQLADHDFDRELGELGRSFGWHDFRQYDLDAPFPDVLWAAKNSWQTQAERIVNLARTRSLTLRETMMTLSGPKPTPFVGAPDTVAETITEWFTERACDGCNVQVGHPEQFRRFTHEVLPRLRERGVLRSEYEADTLRGNLGLPIPENRHTVARRPATSDSARPTASAVSVRASAERSRQQRAQLGGVGGDAVGVPQLLGVIRAGRHRQAANAVGAGAGDVPRGVADHDRPLSRERDPVGARPSAGDWREQRAVLGVGAEAALAGGEELAEPGARQLQAADRLVVTGDQREGHVGPLAQLRQQRRDPDDHLVGQVGGAQMGVLLAAGRAHIVGAVVDPHCRHARRQQQHPRDLAVGPSRRGDRRAGRLGVDSVHLLQRRVQRQGVGPRRPRHERPVDVEQQQRRSVGH
jgi:FMN-dependent oxidoreductase (nitrilotriacetate monooxygenase family)